MNKLCCQVHAEIICNECSRQWCLDCWNIDRSHSDTEGTYFCCPLTNKGLAWSEETNSNLLVAEVDRVS